MRLFSYLLIVPLLLFIYGCSDKKRQNRSSTGHLKLSRHTYKTRYEIKDIDGRSTTLKFADDHLSIKRVIQPFVLVYIFSTRSNLSRVMIPYLDDLQYKLSKKLFVLGIVTPEKIDSKNLRDYMLQNGASFFISNSSENNELALKLSDLLQLGENYPLPLTILFKDGKIVQYYQGITPIEMIYSDLKKFDPAIKGKQR